MLGSRKLEDWQIEEIGDFWRSNGFKSRVVYDVLIIPLCEKGKLPPSITSLLTIVKNANQLWNGDGI